MLLKELNYWKILMLIFNDLESTTVTRDDTGDADLDFVKLAKATNQVLECSSSFILHYFYYSQGLFLVAFPLSEIYLVTRIEKVLQGGIPSSTEPYMKPTDSLKVNACKHTLSLCVCLPPPLSLSLSLCRLWISFQSNFQIYMRNRELTECLLLGQ